MNGNQLIGAEVSLYTGKLRCYLKYKNIPFTEVVASREVYLDVIIPRTGVSYIPVFITENDVALQDTTEIIDYLEKRYPAHSVYPTTAKQSLVSLLLEIYSDEWLVIPAMHYRWNKEENREFAFAEFGRTSAPQASEEEQYLIGQQNAKPFAASLPKLGVTEEAVPGIERSYIELLSELDAHFSEHPFLLGGKPCIGDFGLIGPLYAHLYRDPYSGRLMEDRAPSVVAWVKRMIEPKPLSGDYLANDEVPETLYPVLKRMLKEQGPVIQDTIDQVADWAENNDKKEINRAIGNLGFELGGVRLSRLTFPYMQWMWQRAYDSYHQLGSAEKVSVGEILAHVPGMLELLEYPIACRIKRVNNKMELAD